MNSWPASDPEPPPRVGNWSEDVGARMQAAVPWPEAERNIRLARDALRAERDPALTPLRRAQFAWQLYLAAGQADPANTGRLIDTACAEGEAAVRMVRPGTFGAFECQLLLSHILIGRLAFIDPAQPTHVREALVSRATSLAYEAMNESVSQRLAIEHRGRASDLIALVHETAYAILGDDRRLQAAMKFLSDLRGSDADEPYRAHLATSVAHLRYIHFERTGDPADLDCAIEVAEETLEGGMATLGNVNARAIVFTLSNALASRAELRYQSPAFPADRQLADDAKRDARRAVMLAQHLAESAGRAPREVALAANAVGFALRALGHATEDAGHLDEALAQFLVGLRASVVNSGAHVLLANNMATLAGEIERKKQPGNSAGAGRADEAIRQLRIVLDTAGCALAELSGNYAPVLFNYGDLIIRRRCLNGAPDDTHRAIEALTACLAMVHPGHPRRAHVLSALAVGLAQPESLSDIPDAVERGMDAALEAEAIQLSGAPSSGWLASCIELVEAAWRKAGRAPAELKGRRVHVLRSLIPIMPEPALTLATRRGQEALAEDDVDIAARYADLACAARDRAMLVAEDPGTATAFAAARQVDSLACRVASALVWTEPGRAALLLERSQASVIARLQLSLAQPDSALPTSAMALQAFAEARLELRSVLSDRRRGVLGATPTALHAADAALTTALAQVRALPGLADFLITITDLPALQRIARSSVYILAGERFGMAVILRQDRAIETVRLPRLTEADVARTVQRYLNALDMFERLGVAELVPFQRALSAAAAWLDEVAWQPLRDMVANGAFTLIPCGVLATLPWSIVTGTSLVTFAPSLQTLARAPASKPMLPVLLISDPGHTARPDLPHADYVGQWIEALTGGPVSILRGADANTAKIVAAAREHNTILFYAHGAAEPRDPLAAGILLHRDERLDVRKIIANAPVFAGKTIIIAACSQGRIDPDIPHEMLGPATAFLAVGAACVIAPGWPVEIMTAQAVAMSFLEARFQHVAPVEALVLAQARLRACGTVASGTLHLAGLSRGRAAEAHRATAIDFAHPFFTSAFSVYGKIE